MAPTPGDGHSLTRYALLSLAGAGSGLQDAVLVVFLLEKLRELGSSRFLAFVPLAAGGLVSVVTAPLVSALSYTARRRQFLSFSLLYAAILCNFGLSIALRCIKPTPIRVLGLVLRCQQRSVLVPIVLSALYRGLTQTANFVPVMHDAARVRGDPELEARRRAIATACFYVSYRVGFVLIAAVIALLPSRMLLNILPVLIAATGGALVLTTVAAAAAPPETHDRATPSFRGTVKESLTTSLTKANKGLLASYIETLFYGVAFGQLGAVTASFFNDEIFKVAPGGFDGLRFASFSTLIFFGINIVFDTFIALVVQKDNVPGYVMNLLWALAALFGAGVFAALKFVRYQITAMLLFGALAVTTSAHNLFSIMAAAGYVEPKHRPMSFAIRAAMGSLGTAVGALAGGAISQFTSGFEWIMAFSAITTATSALFGALSGSVTADQIDGAAVNVNALVEYLVYGR